MMMKGSSQDWKLITMSRYTSRIAPVRPTIRPVYEELIVSIWPRATMRVPLGSLPSWSAMICLIVARDGAEVAPLHGAEDVDDRLRVVVRHHARAEAARDASRARRESVESAARALLIGVFCRSWSEAMRYCGACATIGYCTPFSGFSQNVGVIWPLPESVSSRLFAMSFWLMPSCCGAAAVRDHAQLRLVEGLLDAQVHEARHVAQRLAAADSRRRGSSGSAPTICTSIGAGRPKFRIWLTMSAGRNAKRHAGEFARQTLAQLRECSRPWRRDPSSSVIRTSASLLPMVPELPYVRLMPDTGRPTLSTMLASSCAGITSRTAAST